VGFYLFGSLFNTVLYWKTLWSCRSLSAAFHIDFTIFLEVTANGRCMTLPLQLVIGCPVDYVPAGDTLCLRYFSNPCFNIVHPSEAMMHFAPCFRFPPLFQTNFSDSVQNFPVFSFREKNFGFHSPKFISDDLFLVIAHKYEIFPLYFRINFPPYFGKIFRSPTLQNFPLIS